MANHYHGIIKHYGRVSETPCFPWGKFTQNLSPDSSNYYGDSNVVVLLIPPGPLGREARNRAIHVVGCKSAPHRTWIARFGKLRRHVIWGLPNFCLLQLGIRLRMVRLASTDAAKGGSRQQKGVGHSLSFLPLFGSRSAGFLELIAASDLSAGNWLIGLMRHRLLN